MRKSLISVFAIVIFITTAAFSAELANTQWNQSNIATLRAFDKSSVERFVNDLRGNDPMHATVGAFGWYDLAGDGHYRLLATEDLSGRAYFDYLAIYEQGSSGNAVLQQWIEGYGFGTDLSKVVYDLAGDGKDELIVPMPLAASGSVWLPVGATPTWPAVYRLENGKYAEASRDFPNFYDKEVLPELDKAIAAAQSRGHQDALALDVLEKNKILRVLGRDPAAGLQQAYHWMNSDDPQELQCAIATFADIGGHEDELQTASAALKPAIQRERSARNGG